MKHTLRTLCAPILNRFEAGDEAYTYRASHRKITIAVSLLFFILAGASLYLAIYTRELGALIPLAAFSIVGFISLVVGALGNDRAIAKIWGNK